MHGILKGIEDYRTAHLRLIKCKLLSLAWAQDKHTASATPAMARLERLFSEALKDMRAPALGADLAGLPQVLQQLAGQPLHSNRVN